MNYFISGYEMLIKQFIKYWAFTGWMRLGEAYAHALC